MTPTLWYDVTMTYMLGALLGVSVIGFSVGLIFFLNAVDNSDHGSVSFTGMVVLWVLTAAMVAFSGIGLKMSVDADGPGAKAPQAEAAH